MVAVRTGMHTPEKRRDRMTGTLTVSDPAFESLVEGLGLEGSELHEARRFAKCLAIEAGRFEIVRRRAGLFGSQFIKKADAAQALRAELARAGFA